MEEITLEGEIDKTVKQLVEGIPEKIKPEVYDRLQIAFGIKKVSELQYLHKKLL